MASSVVKAAPVTSSVSSLTRQRSAPRAMAVTCHSSTIQSSAGRRAVLGGMSLLSASVLLNSNPAKALLLEEDDPDLVNKAKANRKNRLQEQRGTTQRFIQMEGLRDAGLEASLTSVQRAVVKLSQSGTELAAGNLQAVSSTLYEGTWLADFASVSKKLPASAQSLDALTSSLTDLQSATGRSDLLASKKSFVSLVAALKSWTTSAGIQGQLQGL